MNEIKQRILRYWMEGDPIKAKTQNYYTYFFKIAGELEPRIRMENTDVLMLGSNNYLGMTSHPLVKQKVKETIDEFGVGTTGSRLLNGTMELHVKLEERLARFLGTEECVVFTTGMQANLGGISSLLTEGDEWVISDEANHASIIDGMRLGKVKPKHRLIYKHGNMEDLEKKLKKAPRGKCLIITEGVFSMEGDMGPLDQLTDLAEDHDAMVYVDDAHGMGVMGSHGRGTCNQFGCQDKVDILMGTFSKSFASVGGFIGCNKEMSNWLKHNARSFIFSASPPPSVCATVLSILDIIESDDSYQKKLHSVSYKMRKGLLEAGFNIDESQSAIIPILIGDRLKMFEFFNKLFRAKPIGVFTNPIRAPAVPHGRELLRTSYMATMDDEFIDLALEIIINVGREIGII
ncbi:MAG: aminotransferase class I/II-fold pyridoxal phosphate-dependent enzyme [Candidatus Lokiarchaeota archaeon]|nr:aminotransferase class I/II-fold pyridoxal phosphate-dependent enzyme [Candidatus Lokiarchaeota archaeon]